jgi:hypothetical protein
VALRAKIGQDEAEAEVCGDPTVKAENEVWPELRRNSGAGAKFPHFLVARRSQTLGMRRSSLRELRKLASSAARGKVHNRL